MYAITKEAKTYISNIKEAIKCYRKINSLKTKQAPCISTTLALLKAREVAVRFEKTKRLNSNGNSFNETFSK